MVKDKTLRNLAIIEICMMTKWCQTRVKKIFNNQYPTRLLIK